MRSKQINGKPGSTENNPYLTTLRCPVKEHVAGETRQTGAQLTFPVAMQCFSMVFSWMGQRGPLCNREISFGGSLIVSNFMQHFLDGTLLYLGHMKMGF